MTLSMLILFAFIFTIPAYATCACCDKVKASNDITASTTVIGHPCCDKPDCADCTKCKKAENCCDDPKCCEGSPCCDDSEGK